MRNSGKEEGLGSPFGILKVSAAAGGGGVHMYILPYNYPKFFKIVGEFRGDLCALKAEVVT